MMKRFDTVRRNANRKTKSRERERAHSCSACSAYVRACAHAVDLPYDTCVCASFARTFRSIARSRGACTSPVMRVARYGVRGVMMVVSSLRRALAAPSSSNSSGGGGGGGSSSNGSRSSSKAAARTVGSSSKRRRRRRRREVILDYRLDTTILGADQRPTADEDDP